MTLRDKIHAGDLVKWTHMADELGIVIGWRDEDHCTVLWSEHDGSVQVLSHLRTCLRVVGDERERTTSRDGQMSHPDQ